MHCQTHFHYRYRNGCTDCCILFLWFARKSSMYCISRKKQNTSTRNINVKMMKVLISIHHILFFCPYNNIQPFGTSWYKSNIWFVPGIIANTRIKIHMGNLRNTWQMWNHMWYHTLALTLECMYHPSQNIQPHWRYSYADCKTSFQMDSTHTWIVQNFHIKYCDHHVI